MSDFQFWQLSEEAGVFWLKIHRPDKKNAFNPQVVDELGKILVDLGKNPAVQILVLTTTQDEMFCAGADIEWFYGLGEPDGAMASIVAQDVFDLMEKVPFPVIASIKGLNLTAGFELMLACDMIIAADNAKFGQIETKYGLTPGGGGTQRLSRLVGPLKAREMIYTAKIISAEEALKIGLVNEVVPLADIDNRIRQIRSEERSCRERV